MSASGPSGPLVTCKIEYRFPEISLHFYLHLSSMSIVLAQEGVQITVKYTGTPLECGT